MVAKFRYGSEILYGRPQLIDKIGNSKVKKKNSHVIFIFIIITLFYIIFFILFYFKFLLKKLSLKNCFF